MATMPTLALLVAVLSAGVCATAAADAVNNNAGELEQMVVVGSKTPRRISEVPADVTVLGREELQATLSQSMADLFLYTPGIDIESGGTRFGSSGLSVRGIGGNRLAMEIDGVPVSDQFDIGRFSHATRDLLDPGLIQSIEVLRGPASALYGSAALGGVVAVRTLRASDVLVSDGAGGDAGLAYRTQDNSRHVTGTIAMQHGAAGILLSGSDREGDATEAAAITSPDQLTYHKQTALLKLTLDDVAGGDWTLGVNHQMTDTDTDLRSMLGTGRFRSTTLLLGDDQLQLDSSHLNYQFRPAIPYLTSGTVHVYLSRADVRQNTLDRREVANPPVEIDRRFDYQQRLRGFETNLFAAFSFGDWSHELAMGLEWNERRTDEQRDGRQTHLISNQVDTMVLGEQFPLRDFPLTTTRELGVFIAGHADRGPITLSAALRYDHNRLTPRQDTIFLATSPQSDVVAISESDLSPKLGVIWHARPELDVYWQYAHGFRAPPFEDANIGLDIPLFNLRAIPNPDLKSETSNGFDAGVRWHGEQTEWMAGVFYARYDDFIATKVRIGIDPQDGAVLFQSQNIERAVIRGAELRWSHQLDRWMPGWRVDAAAYWSEGENLESGQPLNSVGPAQATLGINWAAADERTHARLVTTLTGRGAKLDHSAGDLFEPPGFAVLDFYLSHRFARGLILRAGLRNLTDRTTWHWSGVAGVLVDDPMIPVLSMPGRNFLLSANWRW